MSLRIKHFLLPLVFLIYSCANIVAPQGGKKDVITPYATGSIPKDSSINFNQNSITILFSERIQIKEPELNIKISPSVKGGMTFETDRNKLIIKFKNLRPNTTYTINARNTIADLTEGNTLPNLKYIFSTGSYLDSCIIKGLVIKTQTLEPAVNTHVALYKEFNDSSLITGEPDYFTSTDEHGNFALENLGNSIYTIIAIDDKNTNKHWEAGEDLGFLNEPLKLDSSIKKTIIRISPQPISKDFLISAKTTETGVYFFDFDFISASEIKIKQVDVGMYKKEPYIEKIISNACNLNNSKKYILTSENQKDSAHFKYTINDKTYSTELKVSKEKPSLKPDNYSFSFYENDSLLIPFLRIIDTTQTKKDKILMLQDTVKINSSFLSYHYSYGLIIRNLNKGYHTFILGKGAMTDIFGITNDSMRIILNVLERDELQTLTLNSDSSFISNYELRIMNNEGFCNHQTLKAKQKIIIDNLIPGRYTIKVAEKNEFINNQRGDLQKKIQPEKIVYYKEIELKKGFDVEEFLHIQFN